MSSVIKLTNLTKAYGKSRGVTDITLEVPTGSVFGFLGPNGAGKTTTISMLVDLIRPTSGQIQLFGLDIGAHSKEIRRRVGFLSADMALDRGLSGWQQLEYLGNLRGNFDREYAAQLAERLECDLTRTFKHLSRGNRQKVALIATLMYRPELLILDEPTSGLDPITQAEFNNIILEHKATGGTVFISSHVLSEVQEVCDTVAFIRDGELVATKNIDELMNESPKLLNVTADKPLLERLEKVAGVRAIKLSDGTLQATFQGDVNQLLAALNGHKVQDFTLSDTDLETAFMKYYEDGPHA